MVLYRPNEKDLRGLLMESVTIGVVVHFLASLALIIRVLTRPHREPTSRIAWIAVPRDVIKEVVSHLPVATVKR